MYVLRVFCIGGAGVYIDKSGDTEIDHDVEVVGWGETDGVKYWLVRCRGCMHACMHVTLLLRHVAARACVCVSRAT